MVSRTPTRFVHRLFLQGILVTPFVVQIAAAVGLVTFFAYRTGQRTVENLANQLMTETTNRVEDHVFNYLALPQQVNHNNAEAIRLGLLDPTNPKMLEIHFWHQAKVFNKLANVYFGNSQGGAVLAGWDEEGQLFLRWTKDFKAGETFKYATNVDGKPTELLENGRYDARERIWFQEGVQRRKPNWSSIYPFSSSRTIGFTANQPVYDRQGRLLGVLATDLSLGGISDFLRSLKIGQNGSVLILEPSGDVVATSTDEQPFLLDAESRQIKRLAASDSTNPLVQEAGRYLQDYLRSLSQFRLQNNRTVRFGGQEYYLQIRPLQDVYGLNWFVMVLVPRHDFLKDVEVDIRKTLVICIITLGVTLVLGLATSQWVCVPLWRWTQGARWLSGESAQARQGFQQMGNMLMMASSFSAMNRELWSDVTRLENQVSQRAKQLQQERSRVRSLLRSLLPAFAFQRYQVNDCQPITIPQGMVLLVEVIPGGEGEKEQSAAILQRLGRLWDLFLPLWEQAGLVLLKSWGPYICLGSGFPDSSAPVTAIADVALAIRTALVQYNLSQGDTAQIRMAIHSGTLVGGLVREEPLQYEVVGPMIATLWQLLYQTAPNQIAVSAVAQGILAVQGEDYQWQQDGTAGLGWLMGKGATVADRQEAPEV